MSRALFLLAIVALLLAMRAEHGPLFGADDALLVSTAAPACPRLENPCDRIDCKRRDTRRIT